MGNAETLQVSCLVISAMCNHVLAESLVLATRQVYVHEVHPEVCDEMLDARTTSIRC